MHQFEFGTDLAATIGFAMMVNALRAGGAQKVQASIEAEQVRSKCPVSKSHSFWDVTDEPTVELNETLAARRRMNALARAARRISARSASASINRSPPL